MDEQISTALQWFRRIYLDSIPFLLRHNETAFLSFVCGVAAVDALAAYQNTDKRVGVRFTGFIEKYFPPEYKPHAENLYRFRCRLLHNFSPAYFSLVHANPGAHLQPSAIGDTVLDDSSFFTHMRSAAELYFADLSASSELQAAMLARLGDPERGGSIGVLSDE